MPEAARPNWQNGLADRSEGNWGASAFSLLIFVTENVAVTFFYHRNRARVPLACPNFLCYELLLIENILKYVIWFCRRTSTDRSV